MTAEAPARLERVTTRYCPVQDRIRLAGELSDGAQVLLWLTRRLACRMVPVLCEWLQNQDAPVHDGQVRAESLNTASVTAGLQAFAQQVACAQLAPDSPVQPAVGCTEYLVESLDLVRGLAQVELVFRQGDVAVAAMPLQAQPLRQWLSIVFRAWREGEWPLDAWPDWMLHACEAAPQAGMTMH